MARETLLNIASNELDPPREIDLLGIDIESHELNVLSSMPFDNFSFKVIVANGSASQLIFVKSVRAAVRRLI